MREILFRGKRVVNGEWIYGDLAEWANGYFISLQNQHIRVRALREVYPETVGQYIGLTDKNGTKIFEGDIVHLYGEDSNRVPYDWKAIVEFGNPNCEYNWGWQLKPITQFEYNTDILLWVEMEDYADIHCEVIGNIYDNPELTGDVEK